jgi:cell division protein FtsB
MKRRKSFVKRHIIALTVLLIVAIYSVVTTFSKQQTLNDLRRESDQAVARIQALEITLKETQNDLEELDELDFIEKKAREQFKMVRPNEVYFQMMKNK